MKRNFLLTIILATTLFVQCSKDKNDNSGPDLRKGLLAYFEMNNGWSDSTGNVKKASSKGIASFPDRHGHAGGAVYCDGGTMAAQTDHWKANPITVSMWVIRGEDNAYNYFLTSSDGIIGFFQEGTKMGFVISHPYTNSALAEVPSGWIHIAGTYDGKVIRTYVNGKLAATMEHPGQPEAITSLTLAIMNNVYWKGGLDDLRIYNRLLSEEEIVLLAKL